jgi:hypothetical protein
VEPPWQIRSQAAEVLELQIDAEVFGVSLEGSPPTHGLQAGRISQVPSVASLLEQAGGLQVPEPTGSSGGALPESTGGSTGGALTPDDYLQGVDAENPRDVAIAELNYLVEREGAEIDRDLRTFTTDGGAEGVVYQVVRDPGVFIRCFYLPTRRDTLRVGFLSLFDLATSDVDTMAARVETPGASERMP